MKLHNTLEQLSLFVADAEIQATPAIQIVVSKPENVINPATVSHPPPVIAGLKDRSTFEAPDCDWSSFLRRYGRVPTIADERKPWEFRGWLLYYRLLLEEHPAVGRRWDYWYRTMHKGGLLPDPIPQVTFWGIGDSAALKEFERWVRIVERHHGGFSAVSQLLDWFLWGFGHSKQAPDLPVEINEELYRRVNLGPMLLKPYDCIGEWLAAQKGNWNPHAFFPTPHNVAEMMVQMTIATEADEDMRSKTVCDPAVGSGRFLLHASNYSLRLYGADIDPTLVKVTLVNGALYAPWLLRPFPEHFFPSPARPRVGAD